jgi:metallo-beta-lactamase family protein
MSIISYSLGAVGEVTGSKHILEIDGLPYMIDCGAWQGAESAQERNREFTFPVDKLQAVFLTHAHYDHCGLLPKLIKDGYKGSIRSTPATRDLASIVMLDSAKIQKYEKAGPAYEESDVVETINHFRCHAYRKEKVLDERITYTMYDAGHILGSSMIDISIKRKRNFLQKLIKKEDERMHILYTGDLGRNSNPITRKPDTDMPAPDYIFLESTYGNRTHESLEHCYGELTNVINETIKRGGKVIIPSFAVERAQEIIYYIKRLMAVDAIPRVPVYVDSPMATAATGVFNIHPECFNKKIVEQFVSQGKNPFSVRSLHCITDFKDSQRIAKTDKPCIVIAANGMCEAGRVINHLKTGLSNPKNTIVVVGYMAENTLGRRILNQEPVVQIEDEDYDLKAEVVSIDGFSAHADYNEMFRWLRDIDKSKLKKIILVHGDSEAQTALKAFLETNGYNVQIAVAEKPIALN